MASPTAVGVHVFAGGFTKGVSEVFDIACQLETHGFGLETAERTFGIETINEPEAKWPDIKADFCFGNPRCTGFSCITSGYSGDTHGPWAKQTKDIHDLCEYAVDRYDVICWESVQQAFTTGRPLLDYLRDEIFVPKHYRIAHIMLNAASFGNAQQRRRYFFVAYRNDRQFNIVPPEITPWYATTYDAIWDMRHRKTNPCKLWCDADYDADSYTQLTDDEWAIVPHLPYGYDTNALARKARHLLPEKYQVTWDYRLSDMPFSMHCPHRCAYQRPFSTIHSSAGRVIHPEHDRPVTVGELSRIMGWGDLIPHGKNPVAQIAKGVVPQAGTWIAMQALMYLNNKWGNEDWESSFNDVTAEWEGRDTKGAVEKYFDLTRYVGKQYDEDRFDPEVQNIRRAVLERTTARH